MYIGKVIGSVVATIKISHLEGRRLLLVNQQGLDGQESDNYDIAVDVAQAGPGDTVLVKSGTYREIIVWKTPGEANARITLAAAPGHKVVVKGSAVVTGWAKVNPQELGLPDPKDFGKWWPPKGYSPRM